MGELPDALPFVQAGALGIGGLGIAYSFSLAKNKVPRVVVFMFFSFSMFLSAIGLEIYKNHEKQITNVSSIYSAVSEVVSVMCNVAKTKEASLAHLSTVSTDTRIAKDALHQQVEMLITAINKLGGSAQIQPCT
jgi:uncharacterized membrane protein AbrB (regulator of aidB expression)